MKKISNYLEIKTTIPHEFLITGKFGFETKIIIDKLEAKKRHYSITANLRLVAWQDIPPSNNYFSSVSLIPTSEGLLFKYKYYVTDFTLKIELSEEELQQINNNNCINISSEIFQNIMADFARHYNQAANGKDYIDPLSNTYGPMICILYKNDKPVIQQITNTFSLEKHYSGDILRIEKEKDLDWRYYFNKAREKYNLCEYLDSILWCSISLESYVVMLIKDNNLTKELEKRKEENNSVSAFQEISILKNNKIISKNEASIIRKIFSNIKESRNAIVHGDKGPAQFDKNMATKIIEQLLAYYGKYTKNI